MPSVEELKVKELHLTSGPLIAAAHHLGKYCDFQCKVRSFILKMYCISSSYL